MSVALSLFATFFAAQLCAAKPLREWERAADHAHVRLTGLVLPNRAKGVERLVNEAISAADGELDKISKLDGRQLSFANTAAALDFARWKVQNAANIAGLLASTSADAELRAAAMTAAKRCREWNVTSEYRDDIYRALQRFAATHPDLEPEDRRLLDKMLRDFRRAGVDLPAEKQREVAALRKELTNAGAQFDSNIEAADVPLTFTRAELEGMPEAFLANPEINSGKETFRVHANVMWQFNEVEENARAETTRRKLYDAHDSIVKQANVPLLNRMLALRNEIALRLGYASWAAYQLQVQMARTPATAERFVSDIAAGLNRSSARKCGHCSN